MVKNVEVFFSLSASVAAYTFFDLPSDHFGSHSVVRTAPVTLQPTSVRSPKTTHTIQKEGSEVLTIKIREARRSDKEGLANMRAQLWPDASIEEHRKELESVLRFHMYGTLPMTILVSQDEGDALTGFIEVGLRSHADGCDPARPVGFVEGWFVQEISRKQGIGRALMRSAEAWARERGCLEMASDTWIDDETSIRTHQALGFEVVDRCVHFRKPL